MTINLREVYNSDYNAILPLLMRFSDPAIGPSRWKCLFNYKWEGARAQRGIALFDGDIPVGFVGTIFSKRVIGAVSQTVCNFSGGIVLDDYKAYSLKLLVKAFTVDADILLDLTPVNQIVNLLARLGYKTLDDHLLVSYYPSATFNRLEAYFENDDVLKILSGEDLRQYMDHYGLNGEYSVFKYLDRYCVVAYRVVNQDLPYEELSFLRKAALFGQKFLRNDCDNAIHVQHVSDFQFFTDHLREIHRKISINTGVNAFVVESRFVSDMPRGFFKYPLVNPRMYKSRSNLLPSEVTHLYSETFLMGVSAQGSFGNVIESAGSEREKKLSEMRVESLRLTGVIDELDSEISILEKSINELS